MKMYFGSMWFPSRVKAPDDRKKSCRLIRLSEGVREGLTSERNTATCARQSAILHGGRWGIPVEEDRNDEKVEFSPQWLGNECSEN